MLKDLTFDNAAVPSGASRVTISPKIQELTRGWNYMPVAVAGGVLGTAVVGGLALAVRNMKSRQVASASLTNGSSTGNGLTNRAHSKSSAQISADGHGIPPSSPGHQAVTPSASSAEAEWVSGSISDNSTTRKPSYASIQWPIVVANETLASTSLTQSIGPKPQSRAPDPDQS